MGYYVLTVDEFVVNDILKFKKDGSEMYELKIQITADEAQFIRDLIGKADAGKPISEKDDNIVWDMVFKDQRAEAEKVIGRYQMFRAVDFAVGLVVKEVGLDRQNTLKSATMKLQKTMPK